MLSVNKSVLFDPVNVFRDPRVNTRHTSSTPLSKRGDPNNIVHAVDSAEDLKRSSRITRTGVQENLSCASTYLGIILDAFWYPSVVQNMFTTLFNRIKFQSCLEKKVTGWSQQLRCSPSWGDGYSFGELKIRIQTGWSRVLVKLYRADQLDQRNIVVEAQWWVIWVIHDWVHGYGLGSGIVVFCVKIKVPYTNVRWRTSEKWVTNKKHIQKNRSQWALKQMLCNSDSLKWWLWIFLLSTWSAVCRCKDETTASYWASTLPLNGAQWSKSESGHMRILFWKGFGSADDQWNLFKCTPINLSNNWLWDDRRQSRVLEDISRIFKTF